MPVLRMIGGTLKFRIPIKLRRLWHTWTARRARRQPAHIDYGGHSPAACPPDIDRILERLPKGPAPGAKL
jgi:hypothetical protein